MNRLEMKSLSGLLTAFKECLQAASEHEANVMKLAALGAKMPTVEQMAEMLAKAAEMGAFDEREPASDAVRTSAREFIAAVDEHCELEVGDKVEIIGPDWAGDSDDLGKHAIIDNETTKLSDYWLCGPELVFHAFPASSLRKITAPAFKVGDDVEIIGPDYAGDGGDEGSTATIIASPDKDGDYEIRGDDLEWHFYPASSLRKITAPKHKVGDRVKVTSGVVRQYKPTVRPGSIGVIATICEADKSYMVEFDDGSRVAYFESEMEPAPAPLLPVGTLVTVDSWVSLGKVRAWSDGLAGYSIERIGGGSAYYPLKDVQPLIPAYLAYSLNNKARVRKTTGEWHIGATDGKLYVKCGFIGKPAHHSVPLADCLPLALDSRWEVK